MSSYVSVDLRRLVIARACHLCEYCLVHEEDTYLGCQVEHIIAEKHDGRTEEINLAYACTFCNRAKGTDIGSIAEVKGEYTRFFHPRKDLWRDHFALQGTWIEPLTNIGEVTARLLQFNHRDRVLERDTLAAIGRYPSQAAVLYVAYQRP
jgi:HNH endonuclease